MGEELGGGVGRGVAAVGPAGAHVGAGGELGEGEGGGLLLLLGFGGGGGGGGLLQGWEEIGRSGGGGGGELALLGLLALGLQGPGADDAPGLRHFPAFACRSEREREKN